MSAFKGRRKLGKPVSVNHKPRKAARKTNKDREVLKGATNAGMQKVNECYPNLNLGDIMRFSVEVRKERPASRQIKNEILEIFNDAANDYCLKHGKKPRFR